ncbi:MAG: chlorite dismutase family protein [Polyangiaceae bacterium]
MSGERSGQDKPSHGHDEIPRVDVHERGGKGPDGQPITMDRRLFFQLLVFDCASPDRAPATLEVATHELASRKVSSVLYADANAPGGFAVLAYDTDPGVFVTKVRPALQALTGVTQRHSFTMLGRTYSQGHEQDLQFWLVDRPRSVVENAAWPWAVWYPLRRSGAFAKLEPREQAAILREHAIIGRAYGAEDLAHDVRLACHGLDASDNEFVVGLIGRELHPLSHVVQAMRKTRQTSEFISQMGPFFVGYVVGRTGTQPAPATP